MRSVRSHSEAAPRGASSSLHSLLSAASITVTALLLLAIPACNSAPAEFQQAATDQTQLFSQMDAVCSSYISADLKLWPSDVLGELCILMLVQKSKVRVPQNVSPNIYEELKMQENSKRAELQGPERIQNRGYFLYRPRNGRRSLEYE